MVWYIVFGCLLLLIVLIIYVYYKTKDTLKEAFQTIDTMDISNVDLNSLITLASQTNIADISGIIDISGVNAQQLATQLQESFNIDISTVDKRPITDKGKQCDTYTKQLSENQILLQKYTDIGDWNNVRSSKKMIKGVQDSMSKLGC